MFDFFKKKKENKESKSSFRCPDYIQEYIREVHTNSNYIYSVNDISGNSAYKALKARPKEEIKLWVTELIDHLSEISLRIAKTGPGYHYSRKIYLHYATPVIKTTLSGLLRSKLNYSEKEWISIFKQIDALREVMKAFENYHFHLRFLPINHLIKQIEYLLKNTPPSQDLKGYIEYILTWPEFSKNEQGSYYGSDLAKASTKLKAIIADPNKTEHFALKSNDIGTAVNDVIQLSRDKDGAIDEICFLISTVSGSKPSDKLNKKLAPLIEKIGDKNYKQFIHQIIEIAINRSIEEETIKVENRAHSYEYNVLTYLSKPSQIFIKGLVWTASKYSDKETIRLVSRLAEKCYQKIPGIGPGAAAAGNACLYVLGNMRGKDGLGALSRMKLKVRQNNVKKYIDKYLLEGSKKYNVSVEELKEMAVPSFKLIKGTKTISFDDYQLKLSLEGKKLYQQWIKPDGSPMKSVPSIVKNSTKHSSKLKELRKEIKEIQKVYSAQKTRIDNHFILDRTWDFDSFDKYYLSHGLLHPITTKIIWTFEKEGQTSTAIYVDEQWCNLTGEAQNWIGPGCKVKLWHPIHASEVEIVEWRKKMMTLKWSQPIKQAYREIYMLTDAELNTGSYSNRMAAHILKQHQFNSLAAIRDWKYSLMGGFDDGRDEEVCYKILPDYGIKAEYWVDELNQEDAINDIGIWLYIATDQVRFKNLEGDTIDLQDVPKIVFTEIMRDVDLFVGVCSVGNDPQWIDNNGARQTNRDYWTSYSFGDLTEIAKTRKEILKNLLPRLKKIRDIARIEGNFMFVKGKLRTYKIHIGSGNILMEPHDSYLCIVPSRTSPTSADKMFIPFEGDRGLSIVLSKAFLLAEDDKITDTTITSQIERKN